MSDFFDAITAADNVHDVVRGGPGRFVDEERPVEGVERVQAHVVRDLS